VVQIDPGVVDAKAAQRREEMLDGFDRCRSVDKRGLQLQAITKVRNVRRNLNAAQINAAESDAVPHRSRRQRQGDLLA
jgi:hypothetical protein